ncbi:MAG: hypothetical protein QXE92_02630 [Thermofilaceae archaeon]
MEVVNPALWLRELLRVAREVAEVDQSISAQLMRIVIEAFRRCSNCPLGGGEPCAMGCFLEDR